MSHKVISIGPHARRRSAPFLLVSIVLVVVTAVACLRLRGKGHVRLGSGMLIGSAAALLIELGLAVLWAVILSSGVFCPTVCVG